MRMKRILVSLIAAIAGVIGFPAGSGRLHGLRLE